MIDTLDLQFNLTSRGNDYLYSSLFMQNSGILFPKSREMLKKGKYHFVGGIPPFNLFYNRNYSYITIGFCPKIMLKRYPCKDDIEFIETTLKDVLFEKLRVPRHYLKSITLNRIDYKIDTKISEVVEPIIYNLMSKAPDSLNNVVKTTFETAISYTPENGYVEVITYNKEKQLLNIKYKDYITEDDLQEFKGVFRTEVRIKNRKFNYYKYSENWSLAKELKNYLCEDMKEYFWKRFVEKVWFAEPFYRVDVAVKIIANNSSLTTYTKKVLIDVIKRINKRGYTSTSKHYAYAKRISKIERYIRSGASEIEIEVLKNKTLCSEDFSTFRGYIKQIRNLGINPLTFDKHFNIEKIENFAKYNSNVA